MPDPVAYGLSSTKATLSSLTLGSQFFQNFPRDLPCPFTGVGDLNVTSHWGGAQSAENCACILHVGHPPCALGCQAHPPGTPDPQGDQDSEGWSVSLILLQLLTIKRSRGIVWSKLGIWMLKWCSQCLCSARIPPLKCDQGPAMWTVPLGQDWAPSYTLLQ